MIDLTEHQKQRLKVQGRLIIRKRKSGNLFKIYRKDILLDPVDSINLRISLIERLSTDSTILPKTTFRFYKNYLVMDQELLKHDKPLHEINNTQRKYLIQEFSASLDGLNSENFIHADINRKNIIFSKDRLYLVDLEPSFLQIKNGCPQWMVTKPYFHPDDRKNNTITAKTDYLGFSCFCDLFLNPDPDLDIFDLASQCQNDISHLESTGSLGPNPFSELVANH